LGFKGEIYNVLNGEILTLCFNEIFYIMDHNMSGQNSTLGRLLDSVSSFSDEQVAQTIDILLQHAVTHHATDVHIEPRAHNTLVRYRIGGIMHGFHRLPIESLPAISRQIKRLAHLSTNEMKILQEGHFFILCNTATYEIRASIMPVMGGEKSVLHITRERTDTFSLEEIGLWGKPLQDVRDRLGRPHGLILVSTPRHSGKSSTIASLLDILNNPTKTLAFIDETLMPNLSGVTQNRVRPQAGITYHTALRAMMSQDSDIIAINSLPDKETAQLALEAANSGHLVIAGNYSESVANSLSHLRTLSGESYLLGKTFSLGISQRLVRRLCQHCHEQYELSRAQIAELLNRFGVNSVGSLRRTHELEKQALSEGLGNDKKTCSTPSLITHLWQPHAEGCELCNFTGYSGRVAICEVIAPTEELQNAIASDQNATALQDIALKNRFVPLALDGLIKALRGQTTVEEIFRVLNV
jgi:type II secretory ATPase GspE/PulE/Tfp pilus assembly ATPase PilB-like protein